MKKKHIYIAPALDVVKVGLRDGITETILQPSGATVITSTSGTGIEVNGKEQHLFFDYQEDAQTTDGMLWRHAGNVWED